MHLGLASQPANIDADNGVTEIYLFLNNNCKKLFTTYTIEGRSINYRVKYVLDFDILDTLTIFPRFSNPRNVLKFRVYTYVLAD